MLHFFFCIGFWTILISVIVYRAIYSLKKGFDYLEKLHEIPCSKCMYFTGDYRLKCPVNPLAALSEEAVDCRDFQASFNRSSLANCQTFKTTNFLKSSR